MRELVVAAVLMLASIGALVFRRVDADEAYRRAERLYQAGDFEKAAIVCERALRGRPHHAPAKALFMEVQFILGHGKALPVAACYDKYMTQGGWEYERSYVEMDDTLARAERGDDPEKNARRVLEYAKWLPESPERRTRVARANALLASAGSGSRGGPSRLPSP